MPSEENALENIQNATVKSTNVFTIMIKNSSRNVKICKKFDYTQHNLK